MMLEEDNDNEKVIKLVQSSTRVLMTSFRNKAEELLKCSDDIKKLVRIGYDIKIAKEAANKLLDTIKESHFLLLMGLRAMISSSICWSSMQEHLATSDN